MDPEFYQYHCKSIIINITHACNLACPYCYARYKSTQTMSQSTLEKIILQEYEQDPDRWIELQFLGGEPLLCFDLIQHAYEFCKAHDVLLLQISVVTNGTLLTEEIWQWFLSHDDCRLALSYDGSIIKQQDNRHSNIEEIVQRYLREVQHPQINLTIMPETVVNTAKDIIAIQESRPDCYLRVLRADGIDWPHNDTILEYANELAILYDYYATHQISPCSLLNLEYFASLELDQPYQCGYEQYRHGCFIFYDVDGSASSCNLMLPLMTHIPTEQWRIATLNYPTIPMSCNTCCLKYLCCGCYGRNALLTGDPLTPSIKNCAYRQIEMYYLTKGIITFPKVNWYWYSDAFVERQRIKAKEIFTQLAPIVEARYELKKSNF